jgi:hypothetical protein
MLHPVFVGAVLVLLVNDHVLKDRWPGVLTGKLSDIAGLVFFPLLLLALGEIFRSWTRLPAPSLRFVTICVVLTGLIFAAARLLPVADGALELAWGWARWPVDALAGWSVRTVVIVSDPTDLLTLPALLIAWVVGRTRCPVQTSKINRLRTAGAESGPLRCRRPNRYAAPTASETSGR